jgi:hypothetical protein
MKETGKVPNWDTADNLKANILLARIPSKMGVGTCRFLILAEVLLCPAPQHSAETLRTRKAKSYRIAVLSVSPVAIAGTEP